MFGMPGLFGLEFLGLHANPLLTEIKSNAQWENSIALIHLFNHYANLAITRYEWSGLPDSVSERFLNMSLFFYGQAAFFRDENRGFMALPCMPDGSYNAYYDPTSVHAFSFNIERYLKMGEFAYIRNNPTVTPTAFPVAEYTRRMADILRTIDVLTRKMKHPFMITCEEKERLTIENIMKKIQDNEIMVMGTKSYDLNNKLLDIKPLVQNVDFAVLWESYHAIEQMLCAALGIETPGFEKKERLLKDEVNSNNMLASMCIEVNLKEIQKACEDINKMFGLDVWVEAKTLYDYRREELGNGEVYSGAENAD